MSEFQFKRPPPLHANPAADLLAKYGITPKGATVQGGIINKPVQDKPKDPSGDKKDEPKTALKKPKKKEELSDDEDFEVNNITKRPKEVPQEVWNQQKQEERRHFHVKVNCYVLHMIVSGVSIFIVLTINLALVVTIWTYSLGWIYLYFYTMCTLDIVGSFSGIISLMPKYTAGGWNICNWIINKWNKYRIAATIKKRHPKGVKATASAKAVGSENSKVAIDEPKAPKNVDTITVVNEKDTPAKKSKSKKQTQKKPGDKVDLKASKSAKKVDPKAKPKKVKVKVKRPKGCLWNSKFLPCKLFIKGHTFDTQNLADRMAGLSCSILHIAGFLNILLTGFFKFMRDLDSNMIAELKGCYTDPIPKDVCEDLKDIIKSHFVFIWVMIASRTFTLFMVGWYTDEKTLDYLRPLEPGREECKRKGSKIVCTIKPIASSEKSDADLKKDKKKKKKRKRGSDDSDDSDSSSGEEYNIEQALKKFLQDKNKDT